MDNQASKITGSTTVRGVALTMEELAGGEEHCLSWKGEAIEGSFIFEASSAAASEVWTQAISALREDQTRDPVQMPDMAEIDF